MDDITLYVSNSDLGTFYDIANTEINKLYMWLCANKLSINPKKIKYIVIRRINEIPLNRVGDNCVYSSIRFLGISSDKHISWQKQISQVNSKIPRSNKLNILSQAILRNLYFALIQSRLSYGILVWRNANYFVLKYWN